MLHTLTHTHSLTHSPSYPLTIKASGGGKEAPTYEREHQCAARALGQIFLVLALALRHRRYGSPFFFLVLPLPTCREICYIKPTVSKKKKKAKEGQKQPSNKLEQIINILNNN